tara:strand:+ start:794 stop:1876 length:1083 start_codon:yes stop_codon:yes gene_type:complete
MPTVLSSYKQLLDKKIIQFDEEQNSKVQILNKLFNPKKIIFSKLKKIILRKESPKGVYLWGSAGSGKTMLMDICYSNSEVSGKKRIHFQEFMIDIHNRLHNIRKNSSISDPLNIVAKEISKEVEFLCFDEFQVNDIADASILYKLFNSLLENGVFIFVTSNIIPEELYKDGLQRDRFIPFIKLIENNFLNIELSTNKDYRKDRLQNLNTYFSSLSDKTNDQIDNLFNQLSNGSSLERRELLVKGRKINVNNHSLGCAIFEFDELCNNPLGSEDYLAIAKEFEIIFIKNIPKLSPEDRNQTKRLILLIDALYDNRKMTIISADGEPEEIYSGKELEIEFKRCASRLHEMRSEGYVVSSRID